MSDSDSSATTFPGSSPLVKKVTKKPPTKKLVVKPSHPKTSLMVTDAITELKQRGGSSLQAIKKYIATKYKVDIDKMSPFIKKYLKGAVESGALVQTKGKGAVGSFKLEVKIKANIAAKPKNPVVKKSAVHSESGSAPKKSIVKKKSSVKKVPAVSKAKRVSIAPDVKKISSSNKKASQNETPSTSETPNEVKKSSKLLIKKPKAPKPKEAIPKNKVVPAKAAPKK